MNQEKDKITPLKNSEENQKIIKGLEADVETEKQKTEDWKNAYLKSEQERLEEKKAKERALEEKDEWKREAFANRKIQAESKKTHEQTSFLEEFQKLQNQKLNK